MPATSDPRSRAGFTLVEAAVSLTVLAVALLTLWGTLVYCSRSNEAAEQKKRALNAAQAMVEELKSRPFSTLISEFGPTGTTGNTFEVPDLDPENETATGTITFFVDETSASNHSDLGLPLDLNGDGDTADTDVSGSYQLLPVRVTVRWEGALGTQHVVLHSILRKEE